MNYIKNLSEMFKLYDAILVIKSYGLKVADPTDKPEPVSEPVKAEPAKAKTVDYFLLRSHKTGETTKCWWTRHCMFDMDSTLCTAALGSDNRLTNVPLEVALRNINRLNLIDADRGFTYFIEEEATSLGTSTHRYKGDIAYDETKGEMSKGHTKP